jgi:hypothetical protein
VPATLLSTQAALNFRLRSRTEGNGVFEYKFEVETRLLAGSFSRLELASVFVNHDSYLTTPPGWTAVPSGGNDVQWLRNPVIPDDSLQTFRVSSTSTNYQLGTMTILYNYDREFCFNSMVFTQTLVASIGLFDVLLPSLTPTPDGLDTNSISENVIDSDPRIINFDPSTNVLTFLWDTEGTLKVQATTSLYDTVWADLDTIPGQDGTNFYSAPLSLTNYGNYFRLEHIATCQDTNLITVMGLDVSTPSAHSPGKPAKISRVWFEGLNFVVETETTAGTSYRGEWQDPEGALLLSFQFKANDNITRHMFPLSRRNPRAMLLVWPEAD